MKKPSPKDLIKFMKMVTMNKQDIIEIKKQLEVQQSQLKMLAENNGLIDPIPKLKVLDQSVFDDKPEHINWAVVTKDGSAMTFQFKPAIIDNLWSWTGDHRLHSLINQYDASNWQNSLIERESELTGSDLARAYFKAGGKQHICYAGDDGDESTNDLNIELITHVCPIDGFVSSRYDTYSCALLIDSHGDELTAKEVGL